MSLRVTVVDDKAERAKLVEQALKASGLEVAAVLCSRADLPRRIANTAPDVVIANIDSPDRDMLDAMRHVSDEQRLPVVMFAQDGTPSAIRAAIEAGVSAYVVDGLSPARLKTEVDVAVARFAHLQELRDELAKARNMLAERKLLDRAKGILMQRRRCSEDEAYRMMRKMAMDQKLRLPDIAHKVIEAADLLG